MGKAKQKENVKLIIGMLSADKKLFEEVIKLLIEKYGEMDFESEFIDFSFTNYYQDEMGKNISRKFISFKDLINPEDLPDIKITSNNMEEKFLNSNNTRLINIDPGYISLGKLILATTKNQQHRIYLQKGIFAEVTLRYKNKTFREWEWTYPDYKTPVYINIFNKIREIFYNQISKK